MKSYQIFFGNPLHLLEFELESFNLIITASSWSILDPKVPLLMIDVDSKDIKLYYEENERKLNPPERIELPGITFGVLSNSSIFKYEDYLYVGYSGIKFMIFIENLLRDEGESKNLIYRLNWSISRLLEITSLIVFIKPDNNVTFSLIKPVPHFSDAIVIEELSSGLINLDLPDETPLHVKDPLLDVLLEKLERRRSKTLRKKGI